MSQQINLFNPLFRSKGFSFASANAMFYAVAIAVGVMAGAAGYEHYRLRALQIEADGVDRSFTETSKQFERLTAEISHLKPNAQLEAEVAGLEALLKGRQEIIETLKSGAVGDTAGFSEYMRAFSRQSLAGLWLTGFDIASAGNDMVIRGRAVNGELVAGYLAQLNREKALQGRQFAAVSISQPRAAGPATAVGVPTAQTEATPRNDERSVTRYLDFKLSTRDIADDDRTPKAAAGAPSTGGPLIGAGIDLDRMIRTDQVVAQKAGAK